MVEIEQIENKLDHATSNIKRKLNKFRREYFTAIYRNQRRLIKKFRKQEYNLPIEDFDYREITG